jgi:hypothetical protein
MSIETTCPICSAEYDLRHDGCPACTIMVEMRSKLQPHKTWSEPGYLPFEMHGEQFAVTRNVAALDSPIRWRVSHVKTGAAIPSSDGETHAEAKANGIASLTKVGPEKFQQALSRLREHIACSG